MDFSKHSHDQVELGGILKGMSLRKQIVTLALWPFLQNMLGTLVSVADRMIAGSTMSPEVLPEVFNAMGLIVYVAWLMMIVLGAVATGAQAIVARAFGAKNNQLAEQASIQALLLGVLAGIMSGAVIWFGSPTLLSVFGLSGSAAGYGGEYIRIVTWSVPFSAIIFVANGCLRAGGDTKTPFMVMLVVNISNVFFSMMFMKFWLPADVYGIQGLAIGTVISWIIGALGMLFFLFVSRHRSRVLKLRADMLIWDWNIGRRISRIGLPQCFEVLGMWAIHIFGVWMLANKVIQNGALGAHGLVIMIESMSFMPGFALGTAASTLAGQYLGAGSKKGAMHAVNICWATGVSVMGAMGVLIVIFAEPLVGLMSPDGGVQNQMAVEVLRYVGWIQPFFATAIVLKMAMRGAGATAIVMVGSFGAMLICRIGLVYAAFHFFPELMTLLKLWWIMMLDMFAQAILFIFLYQRKKWLDAIV